jgi:hypothetical protein
MGYFKLSLKPGIDKQNTEYGAEGGWIDCDNIRFRYALPEKMGGWQEFESLTTTGTFLIGMPSDVHCWNDLEGAPYVAIGTERKLYLNKGGSYFDITPNRSSANITSSAFTTTSASTTVKVNLSSHGANQGDFVTLSGVTSAPGGLTSSNLTGEFEISSVSSSSAFLITSPASATSTATGGSAVSIFQINVGKDNNYVDYGWGVGAWNEEEWGTPRTATTSGLTLESRVWQFDTFGEDLLCQLVNGELFRWDTSEGTSNRAFLVSAAPSNSTFSLVSTPDRHLVMLGTESTIGSPSTQDPMFVRFSNQEDISTFIESATNTAGGQRLTDGNKIVTAIRSRGQILILTDTSLHGMQFIGPPFTFGFTQLGANCGCISPHAAVDVNGLAFWMGREAFFVYDGTVKKLPCTVQDYVYDDINLANGFKFNAGLNSQFNEITWWYASSGQNFVDKSVTYNYLENVWHIGSSMPRTAWHDAGTYDNPIATEYFKNSSATYTISTINGLTSGRFLVYEHEKGTDANGSAMTASLQSGYFDIGDGDDMMFMKKFVPDFKDQVGNITTNLFLRDYPESDATNSSLDPYIVTPETTKVDTRARGRQISLKIQSSSASSTWRYGTLRVDIQPDGKR